MKNLLTHPGFLLGMLLVACSEYPIETPNPEQEIATRASARSESKDYYWSGGRKIYLDVDPTEMIVGFETAQEKEMFTADISAKNPYAEWSMALVKINDEKAKVKISADKLKKKKVSAYKYSGYDAPFLMTGDILMQPKEGVTTEEILEKFAVDADSVEETDVAVVVHLNDWSRILSTANAIYESGMVDWCHPNFMSQKEKMTNDQYFGQQYYLKNIGQNGGTRGIDINVEPAWAITTGAGIRVAVIDDGVEAHDDLAGRVLNGFTPQNPNGNNGNGGNGRPLPTIYNSYGERIGHGQACAGIIAASHNSGNSSYIAGIAPGVQIIPINTFYGGEDIYDDAAAIEYAWDPKRGNADVISNSWSYDVVPRNADVLNQQINNAVTQGRLRNGDRKGCVVVFSAGNNSRNTSVNYPGTLSSVITVGAVDKYGNVWNYSNRGTGLDVVAPSGGPSGDVYTLDRMNSYGYNSGNHVTDFNGTSAAAPQVSGIAALLLSKNPNLTYAEVRRILCMTAQKLSGYDYPPSDLNGSSTHLPGHSYEMGYGLVDAYAALSILGSGAPLTGGTISTPSRSFTPPFPGQWLSNVSTPQGGTAMHAYQWELSFNGGQDWHEIPGAFGLDLPIPSGGVSGETMFRRRVTSSYAVSYSNIISLSVVNEFYGGTIASDSTIPRGTSTSLGSVSYSQTPDVIFSWEYSPDGIRWSYAPNYTNMPWYDTPALTEKTFFRLRVSPVSSTSAWGYSNTVTISVE